jgi:hypothetical protein
VATAAYAGVDLFRAAEFFQPRCHIERMQLLRILMLEQNLVALGAGQQIERGAIRVDHRGRGDANLRRNEATLRVVRWNRSQTILEQAHLP